MGTADVFSKVIRAASNQSIEKTMRWQRAWYAARSPALSLLSPKAHLDPGLALLPKFVRLAAPGLTCQQSGATDEHEHLLEFDIAKDDYQNLESALNLARDHPFAAYVDPEPDLGGFAINDVFKPGVQEELQERYPKAKIFLGPAIVTHILDENTNPEIVFLSYLVDRETYDRYPAPLDIGPEMGVGSFIDGVLEELLAERSRCLYVKWSGRKDHQHPLNANELLRTVGRKLTKTGVRVAANPMRSWLFESCKEVSALTYEHAVSKGTLVLAKQDHPALQHQLKFWNPDDYQGNIDLHPLSLRYHKNIRKLLEMTSEHRHLVTDGARVYGLASIDGYKAESHPPLFTVHFVGHARWQFRHNDELLMEVHAGQVSLPRPKFDPETWRDAIQQTFPGAGLRMDRLLAAAESVAASVHGMMIVVAADATTEAASLAQCRRIEPVPFNGELLQAVGKIDGAVLLDLEGNCHAIGAILDGHRCDYEDKARGARYNSAIRYVNDDTTSDAVIAVISDDGPFQIIRQVEQADTED